MKFRFAIIVACAGMFGLAPVHQAQAAACVISSFGGGISQLCPGTCVRYVDGVVFLAPCLKAVKDVEDYVRSHKKN